MEESDSSQQPKRCPCGFWGSPQTGLCSKCYKATVQEKPQEGLDAKSELLRNRQSAYASHESVGATSSSYLPASLTPPSAATMEKAGELLRQAVKNSANVETSSNKVPNDDSVNNDTSCGTENKPGGSVVSDNTQIKDKTTSIKDLAIVIDTATTSAKSDTGTNDTIDKSDNIVDSSNSRASAESTLDAKNPVPEILSPDKRGTKRDASAIDDDTPGSTPEKGGTKSKKRCAVCKCKLELAQRTIGRCRCDNVYCSLHRLPELHSCDFDHKEDGRREAREKMVKPTRHLGTSFKRLDSDS